MLPTCRLAGEKTWRRLTCVGVLGLAVLLVAACESRDPTDAGEDLASRESQPQRSQPQRFDPQRFEPERVVPAQRAIKDAPVIKAERVKSQLAGNELVLGVVVNGEARAYPINMLTGPRREIVNDTLGGQAIAATW